MDKKIEKKRLTPKALMMVIGVIAFAVILIYVYTLSVKKTYSADVEKLTISKVAYGDFEDVVLLNSSVVPLTSVIVSSSEGGTVAEIFVENGASVVKGAPLLRIANSNAMLSYTSSQTAATEQINQLRKSRLDLEQNQRVLNQDVLDVENSLRTATRQYRLDSTLFSKKVITLQEFNKSNQEYEYYQGKLKIVRKAIMQENQSRNMQLAQIDQSMGQMNESLAMIRKNIENMTIKAPVSGKLSSYDPVIGKSYNSNEMIGKIDVLQGYKLQASVDEYYINRVKEGQTATCEFNDTVYNLTVSKVIPEVTSGQFQVEMVFKSASPEGLRRGLSLQTKLTLSDNSKSLLLSQGQFFQSTGGAWVFVVNNGKATKKSVKIGRRNYLYYEILDGLTEGDKVITSSYDQFNQYEEVEITR